MKLSIETIDFLIKFPERQGDFDHLEYQLASELMHEHGWDIGHFGVNGCFIFGTNED